MAYTVQNIDLARVLQGAQALNRMRMDREDRERMRAEHYQKAEFARKKQEMEVKLRQAQAKVLQAQQPEARAEALSELQGLAPDIALETQEKLQSFDEAQQTLATKRRELKIDQSLKGAEAMQQLLPNVVQETPAGPQINLRGLTMATSRMMQMAQRGIVDQGQADAVRDIYDQAIGLQRQIAQTGGQLGPEQMQLVEQAQGALATKVGDLLTGAQHGMELLGDPEKRQRYQANIEDQGRVASNLYAQQGDGEMAALASTDPVEIARRDPKMWAEAGQLLQQEKKARAPRVDVRSFTGAGEEIAPLTKGARTQVLKESASSRRLLDMYRRTSQKAEPWMFKYHGKAMIGVGEFLSKLPGDLTPKSWRKDMDRFLDAYMGSERGFSLYRKKITGAQAAMAELEYLRKQAANMDMSWPRFQAAIRETFAGLQYEIQLYNKALARGISLEEKGNLPEGLTKKYFNEMLGEKVDLEEGRSRMEGGLLRGSPITRGDMLDRIDMLEEAGWSGTEIAEGLKHEGYETLTQDDIDRLTRGGN